MVLYEILEEGRKRAVIPKIIHYCWFGGNPIPKNLQRCIDSWKRIMPDYELRRWDESNYNINKCSYMKEAYEAGRWAFVSDYARLDICYTYGGIYLDTDVEVLKPFDDLLSLEGFCGMEAGKGKKCVEVNVGLALGLARGQKMGRVMRDDYHRLHFKTSDGALDMTPCPVIQTRLLSKYGLMPRNEVQNINGLMVFPTEYFCPVNQYTGEKNITSNTYSIHHYSGSWYSPADQERRELRQKYSRYGKMGAEILSAFIAYRKYYGLVGMWEKIAEKLIK